VTAFTDDSALVLRVCDTGSGVDPSQAEQVFRHGWSTKPAGPGGRGLGLALARQTVSRHSGTLEVREGADGGAEFEVRLPLPPAVPPARSTRLPEPALPGGDV
jgi:signal transduction histidine kinase